MPPFRSPSLAAIGALSLALIAVVLPAQARPVAEQPAAAAAAPFNCFAVVAGADCTVHGGVLFAHNEDSGNASPVHLHVVPAREHQDIEAQRLLGGASEPFAARTHSYVWCQMPGLRYSDSYFNEHGVAIATNGCHSREDAPELTDGGITFMLRRIVAARATSARHGVAIATALLSKYGYADTGRAMTIADSKEAWLLNIARGKHWVAARVPDDKCAVIANHFTIHAIDPVDTRNYRVSPGLVEHARQRGWYDPERDGPFDFATVYGTDGARNHRSNIRRAWRGNSLIGKASPREHWRQPTFITPEKKLTVTDLAAVLRDHYEGTDYDTSDGYSKCSPYDMRQPTICAANTTFSTVFELRPDLPAAVGCVMWLALGRPDASAYVPWYAGTLSVPDGYASTDHDTALRRHFDATFKQAGPPPVQARIIDLQRRMRKHYGQLYGRLAGSRDAFETRQWATRAALERTALQIHRKDPRRAREVLTTHTHKQQAAVERLVREWTEELVEIEKHRPR